MEVVVILNGEALVSTLVDVSLASAMVVRMLPRGVRHRDPIQQFGHRPVLSRPEDHVPMIRHPLIGEQVNRMPL